MADDMMTEKRKIVSTLKAYYIHCCEGHFIKEIVEIITQGKNWIRDFQKVINAQKYGYLASDLPDRHQLPESLFWKLLKSRLTDPVPWVNFYDPIWIAYSYRDVELMWLLLKHNVGCVRKMEDIPKLRPLRSVIARHLHCNTPYEMQDLLSKLSDYHCQSRRRLKTVLWGLDSITYRKAPRVRHYKVSCLMALFSFIPEPLITSAEIGSVVRHIIGHQNGAEEFVLKVCRAFETFYPRSAKPYQARSLKHLSRCCIRQKLMRTGQFPEGVNQLCLPKSLKDYIFQGECPFLPEDAVVMEDEGVKEDEPDSDEDDSSWTDESSTDEDSIQSEVQSVPSERLKIDLRTRKFSILKETKF